MKKTIKIYFIFILLQFIVFACCPDPKTYFSKINSINFDNCNLKTDLIDSATVSKSKFRIRLRMSNENFVSAINRNLFINEAAALSCDDTFVGLKSDITNLKISCNKDILDTPAGESIDFSKMKAYRTSYFDDEKNTRITINEMIAILNNGGYLLDFVWYFEFEEELISNDYLKFKIDIEQEDGSEFEGETNSVKIE